MCHSDKAFWTLSGESSFRSGFQGRGLCRGTVGIFSFSLKLFSFVFISDVRIFFWCRCIINHWPSSLDLNFSPVSSQVFYSINNWRFHRSAWCTVSMFVFKSNLFVLFFGWSMNTRRLLHQNSSLSCVREVSIPLLYVIGVKFAIT